MSNNDRVNMEIARYKDRILWQRIHSFIVGTVLLMLIGAVGGLAMCLGQMIEGGLR